MKLKDLASWDDVALSANFSGFSSVPPASHTLSCVRGQRGRTATRFHALNKRSLEFIIAKSSIAIGTK